MFLLNPGIVSLSLGVGCFYTGEICYNLFFLSASSSEAHTSMNHFLKKIFLFFLFISGLSSICLFTEVKAAVCNASTGMGDHFSALLVSLIALRLVLVDRNPFRPCV